jgi:hypothetical protein
MPQPVHLYTADTLLSATDCIISQPRGSQLADTATEDVANKNTFMSPSGFYPLAPFALQPFTLQQAIPHTLPNHGYPCPFNKADTTVLCKQSHHAAFAGVKLFNCSVRNLDGKKVSTPTFPQQQQKQQQQP